MSAFPVSPIKAFVDAIPQGGSTAIKGLAKYIYQNANNQDVLSCIGTEGEAGALLGALSGPDEKAGNAATIALYWLARTELGRQAILAQEDWVEKVETRLRSPDERMKSHATALFAEMVQVPEAKATILGRPLSSLLDCLDASNDKTRANAKTTLYRLAESEEGKKAIMSQFYEMEKTRKGRAAPRIIQGIAKTCFSDEKKAMRFFSKQCGIRGTKQGLSGVELKGNDGKITDTCFFETLAKVGKGEAIENERSRLRSLRGVHHLSELVTDFHTSKGSVLLVKDAGDDLFTHYIDLKKRVTADELASYIKQLTEPLQKLHEEFEVVHLDVKLQNICLKDGKLTLIDLAASRPIGARGVRNGTPAYWPIEAFLEDPVSPTEDIWALGVTLFEIVTNTCLISEMETTTDVMGGFICRFGEEFSSYLKNAEQFEARARELNLLPFQESLAQIDLGDEDGKKELIDLLTQMLKIDPAERITAEGILKHPFLKRNVCFRTHLAGLRVMNLGGNAWDLDGCCLHLPKDLGPYQILFPSGRISPPMNTDRVIESE